MDILGSMKEKFSEQQTALKDALVKQIKTEVPKQKFSPAIRDWAVDNLGIQDMQALIQEFGKEAVNQLLYESYKSRTFDKRRQK